MYSASPDTLTTSAEFGEHRVGDGKAIVMRRYGPPAVLGVERVTLPALGAGELRVRSLASAINHSDLEIRAASGPSAELIRFLMSQGWKWWAKW
jgi:hypothetical protein